jgi:hypothetical protein
VIFMSGENHPPDPVAAFVRKPIDLDLLLAEIARALDPRRDRPRAGERA